MPILSLFRITSGICHNNLKNWEYAAKLRSIPFIEAIWPWIEKARKQLEKKGGTLLDILSADAALSGEIALAKRWSDLCTPTFLHEMQLQKSIESLSGNTARGRYLYFIRKWISAPSQLRVMCSEYRQLEKQIDHYLNLWIEQEREFLFRLNADLSLLASVFNKGKPLGKVVSIKRNAGDLHSGGRSTCLLTFECGKTIVYKPRDLRMEKALFSLVEELGLKGFTILPRKGYGWEEKVEHKPCPDREAVERYYMRTGMWVALLYFLYGTDLHFENLIASGEHPIPIDLETIFHPSTVPDGIDPSVIRTGILPFNGRSGEKKKLDYSSLGMKGRMKRLFYSKMHTDEMKIVRKIGSFFSEHAVYCNGQKVEPGPFSEFVLSGFRTMYEKIEQNRSLIGEWADRVSRFPVRTILFPTQVYGLFLTAIFSPKAFLNAEDKDQTFRLLEKGRSLPASIFAEERRALLNGDIPLFRSLPSSKALYAGEKMIAADFWKISPYQQMKKRLKSTDPLEKRRQEEIIEKSLQEMI